MTTFTPRPNHPYAHAPRFPEGERVRLDSVLPGEGPFEIEIGPGRGGFLFERCAARSDVRIIGFEIRLKWSALVDEKLRKAGLGARARCLNADARSELQRVAPDASVTTFFLHFPDPWWKKKHEKRLVMGAELLDSITRLLIDGGELFVQTDVEHRYEQYKAFLDAREALEPFGDVPGDARLQDNPYNAQSPREKRAIADGLPIHRMRYRKR
jgi:tRNA (guanine-N7-)-methyltransferase